MIKIILFAILIFACNTGIFCQWENKTKYATTLLIGANSTSLNDRSINYFNYKGLSLFNFIINEAIEKNRNKFEISVNYNYAELYPVNLPSNIYEYNNLRLANIGLSFKFSKRFDLRSENFNLRIGVSNKAFYIIETEYFKNLLYDYATVFRKSYDLTPINILPEIEINYRNKRNVISIESGMSVFSVHSQPNDNYVKQLGLDNSLEWRFLGLKKYVNYIFLGKYIYIINDKYSISTIYQFQWQKYFDNRFNYHEYQLMFGLQKYF